MPKLLRSVVLQAVRSGRCLGVSNALCGSFTITTSGQCPKMATLACTRTICTQRRLNPKTLPALTLKYRWYSQSGSKQRLRLSTLLEPPVTMDTVIERLRRHFGIPGIGTETLAEWIRKKDDTSSGLVLLDVREMNEFDVSHIDGARRVSPARDDLHATYDYISELHTDHSEVNIACYCALGYRVSIYAAALENHIKDQTGEIYQKLIRAYLSSPLTKSARVFNVDGSLFKWANERRPMVDCHGNVTSYAHPCNKHFAVLLESELHKKSPE